MPALGHDGVGQGRLAVVDVGYDCYVAYFHIGYYISTALGRHVCKQPRRSSLVEINKKRALPARQALAHISIKA